MNRGTGHLKQIYHKANQFIKEDDFFNLRWYMTDLLEKGDLQELRMVLIPTKYFKQHPLIADVIVDVVKYIETTTGKPLM